MRRSFGSVLVVCALLGACTSDGAEPDAESVDDAALDEPPLPGLLDASNEKIINDSSVRTGTLDNGLRYYIRQNDNPGGKADLRLAIRAGSVDEFGPSTGVAHFVEHMLFNGTEKFPENELIDVLRSFGAAFGADVNAYTSFDETVYLLTVPNEGQSLEAGLNVLEQWLSYATFDSDQVIAERGVVLDEWRVRTQSRTGRLFDLAEHMYLTGVPYEGRSPIGTEASITAMTDVELREYYDTWYRPDNAAITVVGDIDVDDVEADIERLFGPAVARLDDSRAAEIVQFEIESEPDFGLHADPDQRTVDVEVTLPIPAFEGSGTASWRVEMIDQIIMDALVRRLEQDIAAGAAAFDVITPGTNSFVESLDAPALYAFTDAERVDATLGALLDEYERAARFGFSAEEIELAKSTLRAEYDTLYAGRDSAQDVDYADQYVDHFLTGSAYPPIADGYEMSVDILDAITPEAVDLRFRARWSNSTPHVIVSTPESDVEQIPTEAEVLAMIAELEGRQLEPRVAQRDLPDTLMQRPDEVTPASIEQVVNAGDQLFDPVEITYPNGVRVILNRNTIVEGEVFFQAGSPGGSSLVDDQDVVDALYAADVVTTSGIADFNQAELAQILAGSNVDLSAWITPYRDSFAGTAATADLEAMLQLLHLYMTEPRVDSVAIGQLESQYGPAVDDPATSPGLAGDDALLDARYPAELRYAVLPTPEQFDTLDLAGIERVWNDRYGNAADWVFVFSGDLDLENATGGIFGLHTQWDLGWIGIIAAIALAFAGAIYQTRTVSDMATSINSESYMNPGLNDQGGSAA